MKIGMFALAIVSSIVSFHLPSAAQAGDWHQPQNWVSPAIDCKLESGQTSANMALTGGVWTFSNVIGTATLVCPLPFPNDLTIYGSPIVWYRDSDGCSTGASVKVDLWLRNNNGTLINIGSVWDSDTASGCPTVENGGQSTFGVGLASGIGNDRAFLRVVLKRSSTSGSQVVNYGGLWWQ